MPARSSGRLRHNARFVMLVPKSLDPAARGRKLPVPDARPSEKIAKLFPQTEPCSQKTASKPAATTAPAQQRRRRPRSRACQTAAIQAPCKPVPLPEPRPEIEAGSQSRVSVTMSPLSLLPMKRRPSRSIPELPAPPRRKRGLSEEERALWESVAKQVKPLRKQPRGQGARPSRRMPRRERRAEARRAAAAGRATRESLRLPEPEPPPLAPLGRRERSHLRAAGSRSTPGSTCMA